MTGPNHDITTDHPQATAHPDPPITMVRPFLSPDLARSAGLDEHRFPENAEEVEAAEAALSREMEKLSLKEHEQLLFEMHGFASTSNEDPPDVDTILSQLEKEIDLLDSNEFDKTAYYKARSYDRSYVEGMGLRLKFLRCHRFEVTPAAGMLIRHFQVKLDLFGDNERLGREVRLSDLLPNAMHFVESGYQQVLDSRDVSGRTVCCFRPAYDRDFVQYTPEEMSQAMFYYLMAVHQDVDTQKHGCVIVEYNYDRWTADVDFVKKFHEVRTALPGRIVAAHYCYDDPTLKPFVTGLHLSTEAQLRVRLRVHEGKPSEVKFKLQTFGIPVEEGPMQDDGSWSTSGSQEWLAKQREREEKEAGEEGGILIPRRFDVLFGMSRNCKEHTGNRRLVHLCEMHFAEYEASNKHKKADIAERLCAIVRVSQGRFLKKGDRGWVEVNDEVARAKVAHFFRHMRSKKAKTEAPVFAAVTQEPDNRQESMVQAPSRKRVEH